MDNLARLDAPPIRGDQGGGPVVELAAAAGRGGAAPGADGGVDRLAQEELDEQVGWVEFWNPGFDCPDDLPLHVRRLREAPAALAPVPLREFVLPDKPPRHHVSEHLDRIRTSLAS